MISLQHLVQTPETYKQELEKRGKSPNIVDQIVALYEHWRNQQKQLDVLRQEKNRFNEIIVTLSSDQKPAKIQEMKQVSENIKSLEETTRSLRADLDTLVLKVPNLTWDGIPIGNSDADNIVVQTWSNKPEFDFTPLPYYQLPLYKKYVAQEEGVKAMGSRGYFMRGEIAKFQKVLFDHALEIILKHGFELFYVPLMLNENILTGTGHLPDFDGQMYEIKIDDNKSYYLIGSSEPSLMGYFKDTNVGNLDQPILVTANTSCFRKEAGSYGKDQQGILRVHQFEKIEIDAICKPEDNDKVFELLGKISEEIYDSLGIHYRAVEVCSGDIPFKHYRQVDYEAWFPGEDKYREICSNGSASDYQNRGLKINYTDKDGNNQIPWGLNCTGITFRTGLAILEQFQQADGRVKLPPVLAQKFGKEFLE